eukprot:g1158.t1
MAALVGKSSEGANAKANTITNVKQQGRTTTYDVGDVGDASDARVSAIKQKKAALDARMMRLANEREKQKMERLAAKQEASDPSESAAAFWKNFKDVERKVLSSIENCNDDASTLVDAAGRVDAMQKLVADASYFLPPYDSRSASVTIQDLREKIKDAKEKQAPRKKFSFKARRKRKEKKTSGKKVKENDKESCSDEKESRKAKTAVGGTGADGEEPLSTTAEDFVVANRSGETIIISKGEIASKGCTDVVLSNLERCIIVIGDVMNALRINNLKACTVYSGPVAGSVLLNRCTESSLWIASRQIRLHHSHKCTYRLQTKSTPIIEDCTSLMFGAYNLSYAGLQEQLREANLSEFSEQWKDVQDFKWLRAQHSPNWSLVPDDDWGGAPKSDKVELLSRATVARAL